MDQYQLNKGNFDQKRMIDQNKFEINQEYEGMKERVQKIQQLDRKRRTANRDSFDSSNTNTINDNAQNSDSPYIRKIAKLELIKNTQALINRDLKFIDEPQNLRYKQRQLKVNKLQQNSSYNQTLIRQAQRLSQPRGSFKKSQDLSIIAQNEIQQQQQFTILPEVTPRNQLLQNNKIYKPIQVSNQVQTQKTVILPFKQAIALQDNQLNTFYPFQSTQNQNANVKIMRAGFSQSKTPHGHTSFKQINQNLQAKSMYHKQQTEILVRNEDNSEEYEDEFNKETQTFSETLKNYQSMKANQFENANKSQNQMSNQYQLKKSVESKQAISVQAINNTNGLVYSKQLHHKNFKLLGDRLKPMMLKQSQN
eukprot:403357667